jgi:hypothetical protein
MNTTSNNPPSVICLVLKWTLGVPTALLLVIVVGIAARYLPSKARLDRMKSARTITSHGVGGIYIEFEPVVPTWIRKLIGDKRCEPLDRIKEVHFYGATDDELIKCHGCFDTESVVLTSHSFTDRGLAELSELRLLKRLEISGGRFTSQGLAALARCPELTDLKIDHADLADNWFDAIGALTNLRHLEVAKHKEITVREIAELAAHQGLRTVRLNPSAESRTAIQYLEGNPQASIWHIGSIHLTRDVLEPLAGVRDLDTIVIDDVTVEPDALSSLARLPSLRTLLILGVGISGEHLWDLKGCSKLESLTIADAYGFGTHGLDGLRELPSLIQLVLYYGVLSPEDVAAVSRLPRLRSLRIELFHECMVDGLARLDSLVNLEELELRSILDVDDALGIFQSMPRLQWLEYDSRPIIPHPLQTMADQSKLPVALVTGIQNALDAMQREARSNPKLKTVTVSIGQRTLLPLRWKM